MGMDDRVVRTGLLAGLVAVLLASALAFAAPAWAQNDEDGGATPLPTAPGYVAPDPAAWILVDADTGAVLSGSNDRVPTLPGSTIKLLTALVAVQRIPAGDLVPISARAEAMPARKINVKAGQAWRRDDLLQSMLLVSANDAAVALAERVGGGSLADWETIANQTAVALGLEDTPDLSDPAGLDDEFSNGAGSHISARDLAIVARAFIADPQLAQIAVTTEYRFDGGDGNPHRLTNHNRFFQLYPGAIGLKTGMTERAGRCFVGAARRDGRTMLIVMFGAPDIYNSAARFLDQGFATPVSAQAGLDHLPSVVAGAALDPPARVPGALDATVAQLGRGRSGFNWNSPLGATALIALGTAPALALRRRLVVRPPAPGTERS